MGQQWRPMDWSTGRGLHCDQGGLGWLFFLWGAHSSSLHPPSLPIKALIFGRMVPHCCISPSWAPVWLCPPDFPPLCHLPSLSLLSTSSSCLPIPKFVFPRTHSEFCPFFMDEDGRKPSGQCLPASGGMGSRPRMGRPSLSQIPYSKC